MPSAKDRSKAKDLSSRLDPELLTEFKDKFGYELKKKDDDLNYVLFERTVEDGDNHVLILEDHRWEREEANFDPDFDVGDWLIFSMLKDSAIDWYGQRISEQYPLTYEEYKLIEKIIHDLEKANEQANKDCESQKTLRSEQCHES